MSQGTTTIRVESWLRSVADPHSAPGQTARAELIEATQTRLQAICRKMFFQSFKQTGVIDCDDVYQEAALKLWHTLLDVKPTTAREYFGLATKKIREVMLDLCRKYVRDLPPLSEGGTSHSPVTAAMWNEFHEQAGKLDDDLRETFDLLCYHDLTQAEAAEILGVDESTVKRRWRKAREKLSDYVL